MIFTHAKLVHDFSAMYGFNLLSGHPLKGLQMKIGKNLQGI